MKKIVRDLTFNLLHSVDRVARHKGLHIRETATAEAVFRELRDHFAKKQQNDVFFYGHRIEPMFAYVVAALGGCQVIKEEDAGELYTSLETLRVPDFRIVTKEARHLLVEVKNCHEANPHARFEVETEYLSGLREYARVFNSELLFAVYWSRPKRWTLLAVQDLESDTEAAGITMLQALQKSRMHLLGDRLIATLPVLRLRLIGTADSGRVRDESGQYLLTIASAQLYCGTKLITDPAEQRIAWFLMNNSRWECSEEPAAEFDGDRLAAVTYLVTPPERANPDQEFEIVGTLSELVSRQFDDATTRDGEIVNISPEAEPTEFGVVIPRDFESDALPLWRFDLRPGPA